MKRLLASLLLLAPSVALAATTEFCLEGELDLGARYQGLRPGSGERVPARWCVTTDDDTERVFFTASGKSNADMEGGWSVAYLPPGTVRIVNREAPPDIEFRGTDNAAEAARVRRLDPRRLVSEYRRAGSLEGLRIELRERALARVGMRVELPLRGAVEAAWHWDWCDADRPSARLVVDGETLFRGAGSWREIGAEEARTLWARTPGVEPVAVPGDRWPARIAMELVNLTDGVFLVRGVRTGFQHLVVETTEGLVVADAPAGWVELHHLPPSDLVPGLGVSGLSERFVGFLEREFPGRKILAVALTHFHDDHAGGARAFAAAGAAVFAPSESAEFLERALNRPSITGDRLASRGGSVEVRPVSEPLRIGEAPNRVTIVPMGPNPHVEAMLGVWAEDRGYFFVSDVHAPREDAAEPAANRAATECWLAAWAKAHLPAEARIVNSHSTAVTPVATLVQYLDSGPCLALGGEPAAGG